MTIAEKLTQVADNQQRVFDAGVDCGRCEWVNAYLNNGDRANFTYAFAGAGWTDETYGAVVEALDEWVIPDNGSSQMMYALSSVTDTRIPINIAANTSKNKGTTFQNAVSLVTVNKLIVNELQAMHQQFTDCGKLENLVIEGTIGRTANFQWCPLTQASILSVCRALSDATTGLTVTFKTSAVDTAFETAPGAADGSASAAWQAVQDSKPNWLFDLVA